MKPSPAPAFHAFHPGTVLPAGNAWGRIRTPRGSAECWHLPWILPGTMEPNAAASTNNAANANNAAATQRRKIRMDGSHALVDVAEKVCGDVRLLSLLEDLNAALPLAGLLPAGTIVVCP